MKRHSAILITISICTLFVFLFVCAYYGSAAKKMLLQTDNTLTITATKSSTENYLTKKAESESDLDKKLATALEEHQKWRVKNNNLINELKIINNSKPTKDTCFVSRLHKQKTFKSTKQRLAFIRKEIKQIKEKNKQICKKINNAQKITS